MDLETCVLQQDSLEVPKPATGIRLLLDHT